MSMINAFEQYQRQIILPGLGEAGQLQLQRAKVLVIGAGGLGCPALLYLSAAGVGAIGIADGDIVDASNLHRQVLYGQADIGRKKAIVAQEKLQQLHPHISFHVHEKFLDKYNAPQIISSYDIVVDGSDNFSTRYLVNDCCVLLKKPLVYGAIYRFEGQVAVFNKLLNDGSFSAQYRDLFPTPAINILNCAEAGVLGVLPGIIGSMQAAETIKLITGIGKPLVNRLLNYNLLTQDTLTFEIQATGSGKNAVPASIELLQQNDYDIDQCFTNSADEIDASSLQDYLALGYIAIDVREVHEPLETRFANTRNPLSNFNTQIDADKILLFCQRGSRSKTAANLLCAKWPSKKIISLKGGIDALAAFQ